jgi:hypothetical protein
MIMAGSPDIQWKNATYRRSAGFGMVMKAEGVYPLAAQAVIQ